MLLTKSYDSLFKELQSFELLSKLDTDHIKKLCQGIRIVKTKHREKLFRAGDEVHSFAIVLEGAYKLTKPTINGDDVIVHFAMPGDIVGALLFSKPVTEYPVSVVSLGASQVAMIPKSTYLDIWANDLEILKRLNKIILSRMNCFQIEKTLIKSALPKKVANLLVTLVDNHNLKNKTDVSVLPIPLTRQEIADSLGATVESVIRVMSSWSHQGIIRTMDRQIEILKMDSILRICKE